MRICVVASSRHPIREPFAGGLESLTWALTGELARRGHDVTLFAAPGSDPDLPVRVLPMATFTPSLAALADRNSPDPTAVAEHHAYLALMLGLAHDGAARYDVVHNHSLHHLPLAMAPAVDVPMVTTLHTPPLPWMESALALAPASSSFTAVSATTARAWSHVLSSTVVPNGVDLTTWRAGPGGGPAVWSGRLVAEKAPHEAIDACRRAGVPLVLAGPVSDELYYAREIAPRLGDGVEHRGHLDRHELAELLGSATVAVVTPSWDEPYGLVAAEAMACGTPVAAYDRGAIPEVIGTRGGVLAPAGDVRALADAVRRAATLDRAGVRAHAERSCSLTVMVDGYERVYDDLLTGGAAVA